MRLLSDLRRLPWQLGWLALDVGRTLSGCASTRRALHPAELGAYTHRLRESQPIPRTALSENKVHNLGRAILALEHRPVLPGQSFSFWHLVGPPARRRGFVEGRALVGGRLTAEVGGGLCQLSGILYHLALRAGLEVLERHAHSVDLYTAETRFCPLGADATVVFGRKDLRLRNGLGAPILFRFVLEADRLQASLCCTRPIEERQIRFAEAPAPGGVQVTTLRREGGHEEILARTRYLRPALGTRGSLP
ncbi:MAG TPA: VanW family protein [Myxococcota bacterium]|nr:VanW family protein [Myxococcota bacterium]HRY92197.1 VanW family protein [Myxococcota bacterium]HSA21868.1 VanW family protein [Myxococcota bacterium]